MSERITVVSEVCNGKPMIRGARIAVQTVLEFLGVQIVRARDFLKILATQPSSE